MDLASTTFAPGQLGTEEKDVAAAYASASVGAPSGMTPLAPPPSEGAAEEKGKTAAHSVAEATGKIMAAISAGALKRPAAAAPKAEGAKKAKASAQLVAKPAAMPAARAPFSGMERTRQQVMCRTGLQGPGQTHRITWASAGGEEAAVAQAKAWVAKQRRLRGL